MEDLRSDSPLGSYVSYDPGYSSSENYRRLFSEDADGIERERDSRARHRRFLSCR